jgi:ubiquinone/menaquinone biosynthesis C-methylase UbiE
MGGRTAQTNLETYDAAGVASYYASLNYLTSCERLLFDCFIPRGSAILELGVGGGRTTGYLANRASDYVGIDYAASMVQACQSKFPGLEFRVADAADLSEFRDESFDAVVFAFNGIDYVFPLEGRKLCLQHVHRMLKQNGCMIFSSHNPRAILVRPSWNPTRIQRMARCFSLESAVLYDLLLVGMTCSRAGVALVQSVWPTISRLVRRISSRTFWRGEGTLVDSSHGGLLTHYWTPERVIKEMNDAGFRVERVLGDDYPQTSHQYATDWYYYVFIKR